MKKFVLIPYAKDELLKHIDKLEGLDRLLFNIIKQNSSADEKLVLYKKTFDSSNINQLGEGVMKT